MVGVALGSFGGEAFLLVAALEEPLAEAALRGLLATVSDLGVVSVQMTSICVSSTNIALLVLKVEVVVFAFSRGANGRLQY